MATYGYARISTEDQKDDLQLDALKAAGVGAADLFTDTVSGAKVSRPQLDRLLPVLKPGDKLVVWRLDRLGRSLRHLIDLVQELKDREITFVSLHETIDTSTANGRLIFHIFGALAEFERDLDQERIVAGIKAYRVRHGTWGPRRKIDASKLANARLLLDQGVGIAEVARTLEVSRVTLWRHLNDHSVAV